MYRTYISQSTDAIVASTGIPSHKVGPFAADDLNPQEQRYLKRIPLYHQLRVLKLLLLLDRLVLVQMVFHFSHIKEITKKKYGGFKYLSLKLLVEKVMISKNPPTVEFEEDYKTQYSLNIIGTR